MQLAGVVKLPPMPEDFEAEEDLAEELLWVQYQLSCLRKPDPEDAADDSHVSTYASIRLRSRGHIVRHMPVHTSTHKYACTHVCTHVYTLAYRHVYTHVYAHVGHEDRHMPSTVTSV